MATDVHRDEPTTQATCPAGMLTGLDRGATSVFKGIKFATANRFESPVDVVSWAGQLDATVFQAQCPQNGGALEQLLGGSSIPTDEDCLHLNVYTPACDDARRPVLVWIHGGAFVTGTGSMPWYDGTALAARGDVVIVTINYRLGAFGFLGSQNNGTLDQVSALRWVARNIAAFGGDAGNVTLFGESAGGSSVVSLVATPTADDLFHRVFSLSPSILQLRTAEQGEELESTFLDLLGVASVDEARSKSHNEILDAQSRFPVGGAGLKDFSPTDGTTTIPRPILATAAADPRPQVVGTNRDEMLLFTAFDTARSDWNDDDVQHHFGRRFGDRTEAAIAEYRSHRPDTNASQLISAMQTDEVFRRPAQQLCADSADATNDTWMYTFDYESPAFGGIVGSCHGLDIPFAFNNLDRPGVDMFAGTNPDRQPVADQFSDAVIAFARTGDPGWAQYDTTTRATQRIGLDPELVKDPEPALRELWV